MRVLKLIISQTAAAGLSLLLGAPPAMGDCLPLPADDLRALDATLTRRPSELAQAVDKQLADARMNDPSRRVQLYALLAKADSVSNQIPGARTAVKAARGLLPAISVPADARRMGLILDLIDLNLANGIDQLRSGAASLTARLEHTAPASLERSCLLSTRAGALAELGELDHAAADGITAYDIAKEGGWYEARALAAYGLAMVYRRSGLYADAESMIDEAIAWAKTQNDPSWLSYAVYLLGMTLIDAGKFSEARESVNSARDLARSVGDAGTAAAAQVLLCKIEVYSSRFREAIEACASGDRQLVQSGRSRFQLTLEGLRAKIDLSQGRPRAALVRLDRVLAPEQRDVVGLRLPSVYADRAAALAALGRSAAAYQDMRTSEKLAAEQDLQKQSLAVAVLNARHGAEMLRANNRMLEERVARQGAELVKRTLSVRLWRVTSVAATLAIALLFYFLAALRQRERALRREEATLRMMSQYAPDSMCLLDAKGRVRFANRSLFGDGHTPAPGMSLTEVLPPEVSAQVTSAMNDVYADHGSFSLSVDIDGICDQHRSFELRAAPIIERGTFIGCILRAVDITDMRRLERDLIELASSERKRLGTDLHEGLAQELTGITMLIQSLKATIDRRLPELGAITGDLVTYLQGALSSTRDIARRFTPVQAARGSFTDAMQLLASEAGGSPDVRIDVACRGSGDIPDVIADQLYAVVREFVANDAQHYRYRHLAISVTVADESVTLNLHGSLPQGPDPDVGRLSYRVRLVGGTLIREALADGGLAVVIDVPLLRGAAAA